MYLTIVRHITKRGPHTGQILYELNLHAYQGGPVHMRSARYYTLAKAQSVAGDLVMGEVLWGDELPGEVGVKFGAEIGGTLARHWQPPDSPVELPRSPKAASEGGQRQSRSSKGSAGDPSPDKQPPGGSNAG